MFINRKSMSLHEEDSPGRTEGDLYGILNLTECNTNPRPSIEELGY